MSKKKIARMKKLSELPLDKLLELINAGKITEEQIEELEEYRELIEEYNG
jgi:hypothetical protein